MEVQLGQWVVVTKPGYGDIGQGRVGRLVVLDPDDYRPYGVESRDGETYHAEGGDGWSYHSSPVCCSWASAVRLASPEEVAKAQLGQLEGL